MTNRRVADVSSRTEAALIQSPKKSPFAVALRVGQYELATGELVVPVVPLFVVPDVFSSFPTEQDGPRRHPHDTRVVLQVIEVYIEVMLETKMIWSLHVFVLSNMMLLSCCF